jgi:1-acyl-sn-glycerol-3-phosphate acyltransferase
MIAANKDPFLDSALYVYLQFSLRKHFYSIEASGLEHFLNLPKDRPVIAVANHSCWWDGLIVFFLTRLRRDKEFYCMMEEKQLRHYPFFTWLGAFSVDPSNGIRAAAAVHYACKLLRRAKTLMWIFPQGIQTSRYEPIIVQPGIETLAKHSADVVILPVAFAYEFFREQKPQILIRFGPPMPGNEAKVGSVQPILQALTDQILKDCRQGTLEGYQSLMKARPSVNKRWEWFWLKLRGKSNDYLATN